MKSVTYRHGLALTFVISHRALTWEGDYKMHHVGTCGVCACGCVCISVSDFSKTTKARDFLSINCHNEFSCP